MHVAIINNLIISYVQMEFELWMILLCKDVLPCYKCFRNMSVQVIMFLEEVINHYISFKFPSFPYVNVYIITFLCVWHLEINNQEINV